MGNVVLGVRGRCLIEARERGRADELNGVWVMGWVWMHASAARKLDDYQGMVG